MIPRGDANRLCVHMCVRVCHVVCVCAHYFSFTHCSDAFFSQPMPVPLGALAEPSAVRLHVPSRLPLAVRGPRPHRVALCVVVRNTAPYLTEFLEWYRLIGVEHVYLYDDYSTDDTLRVLRPYVHERFVTVVRIAANDTVHHHTLQQCLVDNAPAAEFIGFLDIDELVVIRNIKQALANARVSPLYDILHTAVRGPRGKSAYAGVALPWRVVR